MDKVVIYIHGKGGNAEESVHYKPLFSDCDVVGLNYTAQYPWEAKKEFPLLFDLICKNYKSVQKSRNDQHKTALLLYHIRNTLLCSTESHYLFDLWVVNFEFLPGRIRNELRYSHFPTHYSVSSHVWVVRLPLE